MPPKSDPSKQEENSSLPLAKGSAKENPNLESIGSGAVSKTNPSPVSIENILQQILGEIGTLKAGFTQLDSKIEAVAQQQMESKAEEKMQPSFFPEQSPLHPTFESRNRQSMGSFNSLNSTQELVLRKNSFRLDKPKFEAPKDPLLDGALDDAVLKFFDDCERHVQAWKAMSENKDKPFEGEHNFALISLPASVQREIAHSFDLIFSTSEVIMWSPAEIQSASYWDKAITAEIRKAIVTRRAQGISHKEAVKTIQYPAIAFPKGVGLINLQAFDQYKDKIMTQVARLAEGGTVLSLVSVKDAIISALPDAKFQGELYSLYGHAGTLPGPNASGEMFTFSIKQMFDFIRQHIITIKQKGLAEVVNKAAVLHGYTFSSSRNYKGGRVFSGSPRVHSLDFQPVTFAESDESFWLNRETEVDQQLSEEGDEYSHVNMAVQAAKSKECRHKGIGPDGKVLCPYLGNPETAKCGFLHPSRELDLKGKGVSKATPGQPKRVHTITQGLAIPYAEESDVLASENSNL